MRASLASLLLSAAVANAHIALWDKGLFGLNRGAVNYNDNEPVTPLREMDGLSQAQWFGHGYKGFPPNAGDFMVLPAGGVYTGEHACNRAETTLRDPAATSPLFEYACQGGTGALHVINSYNATVDPTRFGGTALAIAYTSDINSLQPNDMTVISVLQQSVWTRQASYSIPKDLPACPSGGCICSWNWIHRAGSGEGYPFEIYNLLYRCTVSGATSTKSVMRGQVPKDCTSDSSKCVQGPKTPMYLYQADGNNLPHLDVPPMYNNAWGFQEGAQNDIFQAASTPAPSTGIFNPYASQTTYTGAQPTATSLPKGWQPLGCFVDQNDRALDGGRLYSGPDLTIEMGTKMANDAGYKYAMVENGNELWVGNNAKLVSAPPSECNVRCGGDPVAFCGGGWRGNAFVKVDYEATATSNVTVTSTGTAGPAPTEVLPSGWTLKGCSIDRDSPRALNRGSVNMGNMTNAYCASICQGKGYPYAGTEYRSECWCGDSLIYNATSSSDCSEPCSGNSQFNCGGSYRITILEYNANSTSPTTTTLAPGANSTSTTSSSSTTNSTSTTSTGTPTNSSSTTTTLNPTNSSSTTTTLSPSNTTTISSTTTTSSNTTTSSTSTTSVNTTSTSSSTTTSSSSSTTTATFATFGPPKPTTTSTSTTTTMTFATFGPPKGTTTTTTTSPTPSSTLPAGYISLGCWKDSATSRVIPDRKFTATLNTPKYCISLCTQRGYKFAGVENGKDCYCASGTTGLKTKATDCTWACAGDKNQKCGNTLSIEVFGPTGSKVRRNKGPGAKGKRMRMRRPAA